MKRLICFVPITRGDWEKTPVGADWTPLYFLEQTLDWTLFPPNSYGKLFAEIKDFNQEAGEKSAIGIRLAFSQAPELHGLNRPMIETGMFIIEGSEIIFTPAGEKPYQQATRWQLVQSEWFKLPTMPNVSCLWIQAKNYYPKGQCGVAFANLAVAEEISREKVA